MALSSMRRSRSDLKIEVPNAGRGELLHALHLLAASTKADITGGFTLNFTDGTQQYASFPFRSEDRGAKRRQRRASARAAPARCQHQGRHNRRVHTELHGWHSAVCVVPVPI